MWLEEVFDELSVSKQEATVTYSRRFNGYNANVRYKRGCYAFRLSKKWESVDEEIRKGAVQHLLRKVHPETPKTTSIELYEEFLRQVADYAPRKESPQELVERFNQLNEEYFGGLMNQPNLEWGKESLTQLGRYHYTTDTVRLSTILRKRPDLLDFVLYHELLHKKHKFTPANNHFKHHTKAFRADEKKFRLPDADQQLKEFVNQQRRSKKPSFFQKLFR